MTLVVREGGPVDAAAFEGLAGRARMSEADVLRDGVDPARAFCERL